MTFPQSGTSLRGDQSMRDVRAQAQKYRNDIELLGIAHSLSSEWHRKRGVLIGAVAAILSAVVSTSIFTVYATQVSEGKPPFSGLGSVWWSYLIFFVIGVLLILSPVMVSLQAYLKHPEQAATHKASFVGYRRLQQPIDLFLLRYLDDSPDRLKALEELDAISVEMEKLSANSITLTKKAYDRAKEKRAKEKLSEISGSLGGSSGENT
jgi:hypothetical protein